MPPHPPSPEQLLLDREILNSELSLPLCQHLDQGDYLKVLTSFVARTVLDRDESLRCKHISLESQNGDWIACISRRIDDLLVHPDQDFVFAIQDNLLTIGIAALNAFLQANVTGPPLIWGVSELLLPLECSNDPKKLKNLKRQLILNLTVDGEAIYQLSPHAELFCLAKCILNHEHILNQKTNWVWARLRTNFWHQRMLNDIVGSLQKTIFIDLEMVETAIVNESSEVKSQFLLERATIFTHYGFDIKAREDLEAAAKLNQFEFALTGRLGKRTKFQEDNLSQLVVLARSIETAPSASKNFDDHGLDGKNEFQTTRKAGVASRPLKLDLNDDTLLENISFSNDVPTPSDIHDETTLSPFLTSLDPANQPMLQPLDSIILLAVASSIINTSPQDDLTREETLPYATRVLAGKGTNWQIYTQALLVRSRIEAYRSRTVERGVLQLQAVVDQVVADTSQPMVTEESNENATINVQSLTSFLPKPRESESAPVSERLLYIHQLAPPTRWKLEAELADRWVTLGGLRTALEIYQRLQMWAEVALCWAASDREDEARKIIRRQLYNEPQIDLDHSAPTKPLEYEPLPVDAPRLFCILGDLEKTPSAYQRAWEVSGSRYARAQRSLGRYYFSEGDLYNAEEAYVKSLGINPQNHETWFALGTIRLQLNNWVGAANAFGRAIQIDEKDAESWSNLAAALLKHSPDAVTGAATSPDLDDGEDGTSDYSKEDKSPPNPQKYVQQAFLALKQAASIKRDSYRIWQNLLNVSAKLSPPPYTDIIVAQSRLIELLGDVEGERCVDAEIVEGLIAHLVASTPSQSPHDSSDSQRTIDSLPDEAKNPEPSSDFRAKKPGFPRMLIDLVQKKITPLITSSRRLWLINAKISLYLQHPFATLAAYEKCWRVTLNKPGWESGSNDAVTAWNEVVDATVELIDAYESLGERRRESGMGEGEFVCKEWRFKSRSAVRGVLGRAKEGWETSEGYETLDRKLREFKVR